MGWDSIDEMIDEITETLKKWRDIHFNRDEWAENWCCDMKPETVYSDCSGFIQTKFFIFDWRAAAMRLEAIDAIHSPGMYRCPQCWCLCFGDWEAECYCRKDDGERYSLDDYERLEDCEEHIKNVMDWMIDSQFEPNSWNIWDALYNDGFDTYIEKLAPLTIPVRDAIDAALAAIEDAETPLERVTAAIWAIHTGHVSGTILNDYGWGNFNNLEAISDKGLIAYFDQEQIDEYMGMEENCCV